jgi:hypothetical protein
LKTIFLIHGFTVSSKSPLDRRVKGQTFYANEVRGVSQSEEVLQESYSKGGPIARVALGLWLRAGVKAGIIARVALRAKLIARAH